MIGVNEARCMTQLNHNPNLLRSPKAVLSTSREEFYLNPLELIVQERNTEQEISEGSPEDILSDKRWKKGELPADLDGHVFIVGAVGYSGSPKHSNSEYVVEPAKEGWNAIINGEGMIYRLDFHEKGKAYLASRIVKTPDYYADVALEKDGEDNWYKQEFPEEYDLLRFENFFISRLSLKMGARNLLNTAFLPMKFSNGDERLLVTWDNGRPYEIDPPTLSLVGPIGWNHQWNPLTNVAQDILKHVFPIVLSSAHPAFDTHTDEMFIVHAKKNLGLLLQLEKIFAFSVRELIEKIIDNPKQRRFLGKILRVGLLPIKFAEDFIEGLFKVLGMDDKNALYLNRWKGQGTDIEQWQVVDSNNHPITIQQSLHQMGVSKDYIIVSDSAFKLALEDLVAGFDTKDDAFVNWLPETLGRFLRTHQQYFSYPQLDYTEIYIIPRVQLEQDNNTVRAMRFKIYPETAHFLVEYENPNDRIILHIAHTASSDPAEFLKEDDISIYNDDDSQITNELRARKGMFVSPMDVNRLSVYPINVARLRDQQQLFMNLENGLWKLRDLVRDWLNIVDEQPIFLSAAESYKYLWSISMYAWRGFQPNQFTDIYWNCWGAWQELLSDFIFEMYDNDEQKRLMPVAEFKEQIRKGHSANLIRGHITRVQQSIPTQLTIEDHYNFPPGSFGNSPQFVPRTGTNDPKDGYIICIVLHSDNLLENKSEIWIFDAQNLNSGPRYKLSHPKLNIGVTIHTTWLSKLESAPLREDYSVRKDYEKSVEESDSLAVKTLFENDVYPHFERKVKP